MATQQKPCVCITCHQPVPDHIEHLAYFGQVDLRPAIDDIGNFLEESHALVESIEALFKLLCNVDSSALDDHVLGRCFWLGWELTTEVKRRVQLAQDSWERQAKACYYTAGGKEG